MAKVTLEQRHTIVSTLWSNGVRDAKSLHKLTSIPRSTIYDYVKKLKNGDTLNPLPRSGRPRKLSPKKRRFLGRLITANKFSTCAELANILNENYTNLNVTDRTVLNELNNLNYFNIIPKSIPLLTDQQKLRRVEFAMKYRRQNWNKVVFSDETTLQMFQNTQKVFYKAGTQPPRKPMVKHPYKVHAWGAFSAKGPIGFLLFTGIMDGCFYREILTENLFENANSIMGRCWVFQQDNDPKHTANETKKLLSERCPRLLDWPSNSPDLNPIENLWAILKGRVEKQVNKLILKKKPVTVDAFCEIIQEEWEGIEPEIFLNLVRSMKSRLELVIEGDGNKIPY
jgi:transposase